MPTTDQEVHQSENGEEFPEQVPKLVVPFHRKRILTITGFILLLCLVASPLELKREYANGVRSDTESIRLGIGIALFGLLVGAVACRKPLKGLPALIVDDSGIVDNLGPFHRAHRMLWDEIASIGLHHIGRLSYLRIRFHDDRTYLRR